MKSFGAKIRKLIMTLPGHSTRGMLEQELKETQAKATISKSKPSHTQRVAMAFNPQNPRTTQKSKARKWDIKKDQIHITATRIIMVTNHNNTQIKVKNIEPTLVRSKITTKVGIDRTRCLTIGPKNKLRAATIGNNNVTMVKNKGSSIKAKTLMLEVQKERAGTKMRRAIWCGRTCPRWTVHSSRLS